MGAKENYRAEAQSPRRKHKEIRFEEWRNREAFGFGLSW